MKILANLVHSYQFILNEYDFKLSNAMDVEICVYADDNTDK